MRTGDAATEAEPLRPVRQRFDMPRQRIVGLVAMQIDAQAAFSGEFAQRAHRCRAVAHGALEMRNATHHLDALVERAGGRLATAVGER